MKQMLLGTKLQGNLAHYTSWCAMICPFSDVATVMFALDTYNIHGYICMYVCMYIYILCMCIYIVCIIYVYIDYKDIYIYIYLYLYT